MDTIKQRLRRHNGTDYDVVHLETDGSVVKVEVSGPSGTTTTDLNTALNGKQDELTFDTTPTADSTNPVTSGGVKSYVDRSYTIAGQKSGTTLGTRATAEGTSTTASGVSSHAEGYATTASGQYTHAEGFGTTASGNHTHAEGDGTTASGNYSHAEGFGTTASGANSHAEGAYTTASGYSSHADGDHIIANHRSQHAFGEYNVADPSSNSSGARGNFVEIVGNGTSSTRSNARTLDWSGNETLAGKLTLGAAPTADMDAATKKYVDGSVQSIDASNVIVTEEFTNPLNTDTMTLGDKTVYFTAYPDIKWQVMHVDGDYVYLALAAMTEITVFGSSARYAGSTIAQKCTDYLNNTIPNVADFLECVGVNGVVAKVFIPSKAMYETEWDWPKASASNRICQRNGSNKSYWTSTAYNSGWSWCVSNDGSFSNVGGVSNANGFRPAVKVRYHKDNPGIRDLNTALGDKQDRLTFDAEPTAGSTNPVTSGGVKSYVDGRYVTAGQKADKTLGANATAEGENNIASGARSHAEGGNNIASGADSHAGGNNTVAIGARSHTEGDSTRAGNQDSHAEGFHTTANGLRSHAEGTYTEANHLSQHVFGEYNVADPSSTSSIQRGNFVEIVGNGTADNARSNARTLDWSGNETLAGKLTLGAAPTNDMDAATKQYVDGRYVTAGQKADTTLGTYATAEGYETTASGIGSHAEGGSTTASGLYSHAEGSGTTASSNASHAEGCLTTASGNYSHAEGYETTASNNYSHAEGIGTTASSWASHAEGNGTTASGNYSHAEGFDTTAKHLAQHVFGAYNVLDASTANPDERGNYVEIVGNGTDNSTRSNARTLDWSGNETLAGKLTLGAAPTANMDAATKQYVDNSVTKTEISGTAILGPTLHVASSDPTASDGADGDFWFVYEE